MERLCGWSVGVPFQGRPYKHLPAAFYRGRRVVQEPLLSKCDVLAGQRTRVLQDLRNTYVRGEKGLAPQAPPLPDLSGFVFYGWQAAPLPGGACGGLDYPQGLAGHFACKVRLRCTRGLCMDEALRFYYRCGQLAQQGLREGMRLVPPRLWVPVPTDALQLCTKPSSDGRFLIVKVGWVGTSEAGHRP